MLRMLALLLLFTAGANGAEAPPPVTPAQLDAAEARVSAELPEEDASRQTLLQLYDKTRAALAAGQQYRDSQRALNQARKNAPSETLSIQQQLESLQKDPPPQEQVPGHIALAELVQTIQVGKSELAAQRGRLADISKELLDMPARSAELRAQLTELSGLIATKGAELALKRGIFEPGGEDEARLWLAQAEALRDTAQKASLNEEILSQPMRIALLKAQQDKSEYDISLLEGQISAQEARAAQLRQAQGEQAEAEAQQLRADTRDKHPLVQQLAEENAQLGVLFSQRGAAIEEIQQREEATRRLAHQLESDLLTIERKLEVMGLSAAVGQILREQAAQLPSSRESKQAKEELTRAIRDSNLVQIELAEERRQLRDPAAYAAAHAQGHSAEITALLDTELQDLAAKRKELVRRVVDLENRYSEALGNLDFTLKRHTRAVENHREFTSLRLLWMPSRDIFSDLTRKTLYSQVREILEPSRWMVVLRALPEHLMGQPLMLTLLLVVLLLVYVNPRLLRRLQATGEMVGHVRSDEFSNTVRALGLSVVLSIKWPLLMVVVARLFEMQEPELANSLFVAFNRTAVYLWGLEFIRVLLLPRGLIGAHFRWPQKRVSSQYRHLVRLEQTFLPAAFIVILANSLYPRQVGGSVGAIAVVLLLLSLSYFFYKMPNDLQSRLDLLFTESQQRRSVVWSKLVLQILTWVPLAAIVGVVLGYTYTAIEIALLLVKTFVLYMLLMLGQELGLRWLRITRRRMRLKIREEQAHAVGENEEQSPEEELLDNDPKLLNDEGTKLLNVLVFIGGILGLLVIWTDFLPALGLLDTVTLWQESVLVDGDKTIIPVTLGDTLKALGIGFLGWVLLRRLPGLLEILLRQRAYVSAGSAYAASHIFQYVATTVLVVVIMGTLGGSWGQIQWAVAALSVGIGFGLQEIVANFISGLIILFEQPIRVGDTVTVGEISGTVTNIRIRATTVRDWDGRELLVPNKEFVTKQLLNWSLSDRVTRSTVEVGVAYGTDLAIAMGIVSKAAHDHSLVLPEPEPLVTFESFGDNSLLIKVRFFSSELDKRIRTASELRLDINKRFNEAGIVVAFPQRDVHLDTSQPLDVRLRGDAGEAPA